MCWRNHHGGGLVVHSLADVAPTEDVAALPAARGERNRNREGCASGASDDLERDSGHGRGPWRCRCSRSRADARA